MDLSSGIFLFGILTICIIVVTVALVTSSNPVGTETQSRKELCILEKELKYPTASNYTINRLCYLEELGRSLSE